MAASLISALSNNSTKIDPQQFRLDPNSKKLDLVVGSSQASGGSATKESSVQKIARFKPNQLKGLSSDIQASVSKRKQVAQVRSATADLVRNKVTEIRNQNPFTKNNPLESQSGGRINVSA